jgi:hypothetical protein
MRRMVAEEHLAGLSQGAFAEAVQQQFIQYS